MYEAFYGLTEKPFSLTPDPGFFYRFAGHQEVLNVLLVALRNGEGFMQVTGEVGTGKTLICRRLLSLLSDHCATVYLPNPLLSPTELYRAIAEDLQLAIPGEATLQDLARLILHELVRLKTLARPLVILIDEAQAMSQRSLEALRLLSNLETNKEKLLHIIFFAQPEFKQRLAMHDLRQLRQRITFACDISPMNSAEIGNYLHHRLQIAGYQGGILFSATAVGYLARASRGVPRVVNLLAHKALLVAYGVGAGVVTRRMVVKAVRDTAMVAGGMPPLGQRRLLLECSGVLVLAVAIVAAWGFLR